MKSALLVLAAVTLTSALAGCRDSLEPPPPAILPVSQIEAPASIAAGSSLTVTLTVNIGCDRIERLEIQRNASGAYINALGRSTESRQGYLCTMSAIDKRTVTFDPPFASTFTVSANRGRMPPVQVTVEVQ